MKKLSENLQIKVDKLETTFGRESVKSDILQESRAILPLTLKKNDSQETAQLPMDEVDQIKKVTLDNKEAIQALAE